jgi:hypothetical protein
MKNEPSTDNGCLGWQQQYESNDSNKNDDVTLMCMSREWWEVSYTNIIIGYIYTSL